MVAGAPSTHLHPLPARHRVEILRVARDHGVDRISVIGSFARGEARDGSDVDFLIEAGANTTPWSPGGLVADMQELLNRRVDVAEPDALHPRNRERVPADAVSL